MILRAILLLWILLSTAGAGILMLPSSQRTPLVSANNWIYNGFYPNGEPGATDLPPIIRKNPDTRFWRSWSPETGVSSGKIVTTPFLPISNILSVPMVGYPAFPGNTVYIENVRTGERQELRYGNLHENWQEYLFRVPRSWRGDLLRVGAESKSSIYVGVGTPFSAPFSAWLQVSLPVVVFIHGAAFFLLYLAIRPFLYVFEKAGLLHIAKSRLLLPPIAVSFLGMILFFLFFFFKSAPGAARFFITLIIFSGIFLSATKIRQLFKRPLNFLYRRPAMTGWFIVSLAAVVLLYAQSPNSLQYTANYRFTPASWSTDNQLPLQLSIALERGTSLDKLDWGTWLVSDRTPAFAGFLTLAETGLRIIPQSRLYLLLPLFNTIFGACVLASWVLPVWVLAKSVGLCGKQRIFVIVMLACSPFVFFNTIYIWPKLLSSTLLLVAWVILALNRHSRNSTLSGALAGFTAGLSVMSHGSAAFGVMALGIVLFISRPRELFIPLVVFSALFIMTVLPWTIWVKNYYPPGNALAKYAFAGTFGFDEREKTLVATVRDAYRHETIVSIAKRRIEGIKTWAGLYSPVQSHMGDKQEGNIIRGMQFFNLMPALGLLVIPLFLLPFRPKQSEGLAIDLYGIQRSLALLGIVGLFTQLFLMWGLHINHHYSFSTIFALHTVAVIELSLWRPSLRRILSLFVILSFLYIWIVSTAINFGAINWGSWVASLISCLIAIFYIWQSSNSSTRMPVQSKV